MPGLSHDIGAKIAKALASGDKAAAADLAGRIAAAQASGDASGFDGDLAALQRVAGLAITKAAPPASQSLTKAMAARPTPDIEARLRVVEHMAKVAVTPSEICATKAALDTLASDVRSTAVLKAIHANPRTMGAQP